MRALRVDPTGPVPEVGAPGVVLGHRLDRRQASSRIGERGGARITDPGDTERDDADEQQRERQRATAACARRLGDIDAFAHRSDPTHGVSIGRGTGYSLASSSVADARLLEQLQVGRRERSPRRRSVERSARVREPRPRIALRRACPRATSVARKPSSDHTSLSDCAMDSTSVGSNCAAASPASSASEVDEEHDRKTGRERLEHREAEPLEERRKHEAASLCVEMDELLV